MSYLLDTCVISELVSARPAPVVLEWMNSVEATRLFLSVLTIGEIKRGIVRLPAFKRRSALGSWLEQDLSLRFHGRILSLDGSVMLTWGQLGYHTRPCVFLNISGYYDSLFTFRDHCVESRFVTHVHRKMIITETDPAALLDSMQTFAAPDQAKWLDRFDL